MSFGRMLSSTAAVAAVAAGVVIAVAAGRPAQSTTHPAHVAEVAHRHIPATKTFADSGTTAAAPTRSTVRQPVSTPSPATRSTATPTIPATHPGVRTTAVAMTRPAPVVSRHAVTRRPTTDHVRHAAPAARTVGSTLPLHMNTGNATRVITVTSPSAGRTTATLQAWTKVSHTRWVKYGVAVTAHIGADGMSTHASESRSATPIGSFTLTQAFGRDSNPGTRLPYFQTTPSDYWISDEGPLYNTHQRCGSCGYNDGVNERLYYETPYYDYAVVIDYNTRNAPGGVKAGRGSAFFLHVTDGTPTAGCVAIPEKRLVPIMRWLVPSTHPRILIGTV